ncbi:MAG: hypothetical protein ACOYMG_17735 [Candidatus Methylumidiphilus sp.]
MTKPYEGKEFEALKLRYDDHVALLRKLTDLDLQIFGGYLTLALGFGSWASQHPQRGPWVILGLLLIAFALSLATAALLHYNFRRRKEAVETLKNINMALGYEAVGAYIEGKKINAETTFRPWRGIYLLVIFAVFLGLVIILLNA